MIRIIFFYPQVDGFREALFDVVKRQVAERIVFWAATDEAMMASQIAARARYLKPKLVQVRKLDFRWFGSGHLLRFGRWRMNEVTVVRV